ncbi:ATP-binding protein [Paraburkholderia phenazinium]|uniref:ATP-binding protein n=1 Tax=Paraburkholderia phenazinium TaxID=60549 RepID=UPI003F686497
MDHGRSAEASGNGGFRKWLLQIARVDVLLLDDWVMAPLDEMVRNDLLEMIDDRSAGKATIVTS